MKTKREMKIKAQILREGSQIKRVINSSHYGSMTLPKELIGKFVKVSLLNKKEEEELEGKFKRIEKMKEELEQRKTKLLGLQRDLHQLKRLKEGQKEVKFTRLSRIKSLKKKEQKQK